MCVPFWLFCRPAWKHFGCVCSHDCLEWQHRVSFFITIVVEFIERFYILLNSMTNILYSLFPFSIFDKETKPRNGHKCSAIIITNWMRPQPNSRVYAHTRTHTYIQRDSWAHSLTHRQLAREMSKMEKVRCHREWNRIKQNSACWQHRPRHYWQFSLRYGKQYNSCEAGVRGGLKFIHIHVLVDCLVLLFAYLSHSFVLLLFFCC